MSNIESAALMEGMDNPCTLPDLWQRRTALNHAEMASLYTIVRRALTGYHPFELQALAEDKEELISQFLFSKVFRLETPAAELMSFPAHSAPSNSHAVCSYFRRYLIDCLRSASHRRNVSIDENEVLAELDQRSAMHADPVSAALFQYGLDEDSVRASAVRFIGSLDEAAQLLLAGTLGWLSAEKGGLAQIAARYGIASYHHRARKLGVTLRKGAMPADFARTGIGRWIEETLGIEIAVENRIALLAVLGILAEQSQLAQGAPRVRHEHDARAAPEPHRAQYRDPTREPMRDQHRDHELHE
ncbi:hypothetical protein [Paraburkholderia sacchari]|uniref:hypothetical protein n=1 Tax=Paraburkholderia sacchari TaxID=159450 RepID=UPI003CC8328E